MEQITCRCGRAVNAWEWLCIVWKLNIAGIPRNRLHMDVVEQLAHGDGCALFGS